MHVMQHAAHLLGLPSACLGSVLLPSAHHPLTVHTMPYIAKLRSASPAAPCLLAHLSLAAPPLERAHPLHGSAYGPQPQGLRVPTERDPGPAPRGACACSPEYTCACAQTCACACARVCMCVRSL